jgi:AcrR family transcriptional regulator
MLVVMTASRTARDRVRAELTREIKEEARRQLAHSGAVGLSLRAVARELGMVSSALYRYFPSRDELLTALIIDAYDALGEVAEAVPPGPPRERWRAVCHAVRGWALAHRHEYALIYGSPVPGYQAPQDTIPSAGRVVMVLIDVLVKSPLTPAFEGPPLTPALAAQAENTARALGVELPPETTTRAVIAWTQLFGMISFELFGQLVGSMDPSEEFFAHAVEQMADFLGLPL